MIDTDKYEGHTEGPWDWWNDYIRDTSENELHIAKMEYDYISEDAQLIADAPLLLEAYKQLRDGIRYWFDTVAHKEDDVMVQYFKRLIE